MYYKIITFGCQMNERDTEVLAGMLEEMGFNQVEDSQQASIIMINTCCVREKAENKVFGLLGRLSRIKQQNPNLILGICGCMVQQPAMVARLRRQAPWLDLILGTHNLHQLPQMLRRVQETGVPVTDVWETEGHVVENLPSSRRERFKAFTSITYGCDNYCTYCIVPYVRGRERSRQPEAILEELSGLSQQGIKEVMLLGQNVNSYGKDLASGWDFARLLEAADQVGGGLQRIRYMTSHPRDFNRELIKVIAASSRVCEHFHLPVQAGSNTVLERMNRGYTREKYLELVAAVRSLVPQASITTDLIVGFPGETEQDFVETLDLAQKVGFDAAFTFAYSPRRGTPAADMPDQVPLEVRKSRLYRLLEIQNQQSLQRNQALVGKTMEVLVEGPSKNDPDRLSARTRTNKLVIITGNASLIGQLVAVRLTKAQTWSLEGELVNKQESGEAKTNVSA